MNENQLVNVDEIEKNALKKVIDGITGLATSGITDKVYSANRILKSLISGEFLFEMQKEWDYYCEKGKIDLEYENSKPYLNTLSELLDYLDSGITNNEVAETLKKLFFIPAFKKIKDSDELLSIEYMKIIKQMSGGELTVLFTAYKALKSVILDMHWGAHEWINYIAENSNLKYTALVNLHEEKLIQLRLISDRTHSDRSGISVKPYFRLTDLGYNLCRYIELYDTQKINRHTDM